MQKLGLETVIIRLHGTTMFNPLNAELNPICHLLALLGAHHIRHISRIRVKKILSGVFSTLNGQNKSHSRTERVYLFTVKPA